MYIGISKYYTLFIIYSFDFLEETSPLLFKIIFLKKLYKGALHLILCGQMSPKSTFTAAVRALL